MALTYIAGFDGSAASRSAVGFAVALARGEAEVHRRARVLRPRDAAAAGTDPGRRRRASGRGPPSRPSGSSTTSTWRASAGA